jgi:hypothetical protein
MEVGFTPTVWGGPAMLPFIVILAPFVVFADRQWLALGVALELTFQHSRPEPVHALRIACVEDDVEERNAISECIHIIHRVKGAGCVRADDQLTVSRP